MRWLLCLFGLAIASILHAAETPHVIVILIDDFGYGDPSCYGNKLCQTPHLDRMASHGIRFTQGYVAAPICSPSRCGLITGQFPARWKINSYLQTKAGNLACEMEDYLDPQAPSLPRLFQAAGYATAHIGKWHLGGGRDVTDAPKFKEYGYDQAWGTYESPEPAAALGLKTLPWGNQKDLEPQQVPRHNRTRWMIDQTLDFLKQHPQQRCFVNLWLDDTHTPFVPSDEQVQRIKQPNQGQLLTNYRAVLTETDRQIGRLLEQLAGTNTLVILLGDNGSSPPFPRERQGGLRGQKLSLYEGGIRVPFITWWPKQYQTGQVNERTVIASIDLVPSLAEICGLKLPANYTSDGENLSSALRGEQPVRTKPLYWEYGRNETSFKYPDDAQHKSPKLAIRRGDWKLLVQHDGTGAELYDLQQDRAEEQNLAKQQPALVQTMSSEILKWQQSVPKRQLKR
jgi:arylsulfatase A-like enzyme